MKLDLPNNVVVTGGSRGLGEALIQRLLDNGSAVATSSRSRPQRLDTWQAEAGDRILWHQVTSSAPRDAGQVVKLAVRRFGGLDALVNNAAVAHDGLFTMLSGDDVATDLRVNLESTIRVSQVGVKAMLIRGGGSVLNISSVTGLRGFRGVSVYAATKAGLDGLTRSLAKEFGRANVRVNSLSPGYFESAMSAGLDSAQRDRIRKRTPLGRLATIDEVVDAACFLLSDQGRFITGQNLTIDGGLTC